MNIKELIRYDLPDFTGIVVADGAAYLETIRKLGASVAWRFNITNALKFDKIIIAGNMKSKNYNNKGDYFIADIKNIVTIRKLAKMLEYKEIVDYQNKNFGNWISKQLNIKDTIEPLGIDHRNAILFENPTEIREFSTSYFRNLSNPVTYIK